MKSPPLETMTAEANTAGAWAEGAKRVLEAYRGSGQVPYAKGTGRRWAGCAMVPLCCWPCGLWSCLMRCAACPIQCACRGAGFACSDNGCTRLTDDCIAASFNDAWARVRVPAVPDDTDRLTAAERAAMIDALKGAMEELRRDRPGAMYTVRQYQLMDALFAETLGKRCHPYESNKLMQRLLEELESRG